MNPKEARDLVKAVHAASKAGESTRAQYARAGPRVLDQVERASAGITRAGLLEVADAEHWKKQTICSNRSALVHELADRTSEALRAYNRADKAGRKDEAREQLGEVKRLANGLADLRQELPAMKREPKNSARRLLAPARRAAAESGYKDWRQAVIDKMPEKDRPLAAVMAVTGCRPAELDEDHGVTMRAEGGKLVCTIQGAKVNAKAGQSWRTLRIDPGIGRLERQLYDIAKAHGEQDCRVSERDTARAFSCRLKRHATRALGVQIDTYCYRHQFASDLKASGCELQTIAAAMGHSTDQCQRAYGAKGLGTGGRGLEATAEREAAHHQAGKNARYTHGHKKAPEKSGPDHQMQMGG